MILGTLKSTRLHFADLLRGLLMVHMALDHASLFWNRDRFADEFWNALPTPVDFPNFIARFTGFPVAPGFSFMAGFMVAITDAGRAARGETESAVRRRLLTRAGLLILIELVGFSLAMGHVQVGVLTCLGVCLAITTFVRRAPLRVLFPVALAILALHPLLRGLWTDSGGVTIKLLHQAGRFPGFDVYYPLIPWIGVMLLGVAAGRRYLEKGPRDWPVTRRRGRIRPRLVVRVLHLVQVPARPAVARGFIRGALRDAGDSRAIPSRARLEVDSSRIRRDVRPRPAVFLCSAFCDPLDLRPA
jgi:uncharacterized membrane protein